jgi:hypothetical protein
MIKRSVVEESGRCPWLIESVSARHKFRQKTAQTEVLCLHISSWHSWFSHILLANRSLLHILFIIALVFLVVMDSLEKLPLLSELPSWGVAKELTRQLPSLAIAIGLVFLLAVLLLSSSNSFDVSFQLLSRFQVHLMGRPWSNSYSEGWMLQK